MNSAMTTLAVVPRAEFLDDLLRNHLKNQQPAEKPGDGDDEHDADGEEHGFPADLRQIRPADFLVDEQPEDECIETGNHRGLVGVNRPLTMPPMMMTGAIKGRKAP